MHNREAWRKLLEVAGMVDTAYGLALLADYRCADSLIIPEELEAAQQAPMAAARMLLLQAKALLSDLEPVISELEERAAS